MSEKNKDDIKALLLIMVILGFLLSFLGTLGLQAIMGFKDGSKEFDTISIILFIIGCCIPVICAIVSAKKEKDKINAMGKKEREKYLQEKEHQDQIESQKILERKIKKKYQEKLRQQQKNEGKIKHKGLIYTGAVTYGLLKGLYDASGQKKKK